MTKLPDPEPPLLAKIRSLRERAGHSLLAMSKLMGYASISGWQRYEPGGNYTKDHLSFDIIQKMMPHLEGKGDPPITRSEILALGGLSMASEITPSERKRPKLHQDEIETELRGGRGVTVTELDVQATAGNGQWIEEDGHNAVGNWTFPSAFIRARTRAQSQDMDVIRVRGDSMEPILCSNDRVIVDKTDRVPSPPGLFVVFDGLGTVIKRIELVPQSSPIRLRLSSENQHYSSYECSIEEANIVGRVIGVMRIL